MKKVILLLMMLALYGCEQSVEAPAEPIVGDRYSQTGTVLETIDVETYTYVRLNVEGSEVWLASNPVRVSEGDVVGFADAMLMKDFHSEVLDRTFADILFVGNVELIESATAGVPAGQVATPQAVNPHENLKTQVNTSSAPATQAPADVQPLEGGATIAAIFVEYEQMEGQEVSLRAKVIKFSSNILGKNWITLQDGTGTAPDNALVVTSSEIVALGDEVIVKGLIKSNVDLGAGYNYKVLLEEASFDE